MRTKTLLLTAALSAAGVATSMAQVYSVNMVGYINQQIPQGFSMIGNHLNNSPDNRVINLFTAPPNLTTIYKYNTSGPNAGGFSQVRYSDGEWELDTTLTLGPGEGAFINAPSAFTQTFVGEVATGTSTVNLPVGFSIVSSALPQSLPVSQPAPAGLAIPVAPLDQIFRYNPVTDQYATHTYTGDVGEEWDGGEPVPAIGEAFWFRNRGTTARTWTRNFSVSGQ
jgi:hypothetical protein